MIRYKKDDEIYNGRYVKVDGMVIVNPTEEMLEHLGYVREEYEPEVTLQTEPDTEEVVNQIKELLQGTVNGLADEEAAAKPALFPSWASKVGQQVKAGERLWFNGHLYKVVQPHTVERQNQPSVYTTSLYAEIGKSDPTKGTPGNPIAFLIGMSLRKGLYYRQDGVLYECVESLPNCTRNLKDIPRYVRVYNPGGGGTTAEHGGSKDNPIMFQVGVSLMEGKYYKQAGVVYKCLKFVPNCMYDLKLLVARKYVEKV